MRRRLVPALLTALLAAVAACDDTEDTGPQTDSYRAELRGSNEVPANTSAATGRGTVTLTGNALTYQVDVANLSSRPVGAHIHVGPAGANGGVVLNFFTGGAASIPDIRTGTLVASTAIDLSAATVAGLSISGDSLRRLITTGNAYVNVHTQTFPGGEVRAQLLKQ